MAAGLQEGRGERLHFIFHGMGVRKRRSTGGGDGGGGRGVVVALLVEAAMAATAERQKQPLQLGRRPK